MKAEKKFSLRGRIKSFQHAFTGIWTLITTQHNAWIHVVAMVVVVVCGVTAKLSAMEWGLIVFAIVGVLVAEAFNTALEFLADAAHPNFHPLVKKAKDVAAGAVLIAAAGAAMIGAIVFGAHLCR